MINHLVSLIIDKNEILEKLKKKEKKPIAISLYAQGYVLPSVYTHRAMYYHQFIHTGLCIIISLYTQGYVLSSVYTHRAMYYHQFIHTGLCIQLDIHLPLPPSVPFIPC
jgi:uncharacterized membrane protein (DUF485 family)